MADEAEAMQGNHEPSEAPDAPWNYHTPGPEFELDNQIDGVWLDLKDSLNGSHDHVPTATFDIVERPAHYNAGKQELIDVMENHFTTEQLRGYLEGNLMKYIWRHPHKGNPVQDLQKAEWFLRRLRSTWETRNNGT